MNTSSWCGTYLSTCSNLFKHIIIFNLPNYYINSSYVTLYFKILISAFPALLLCHSKHCVTIPYYISLNNMYSFELVLLNIILPKYP